MQPRGRVVYFVGFETEAVMRAWNPDRQTVERITAARVDDGRGLHDPQERQSRRERVGSDHSIHNTDSEEQLSESNDESDEGLLQRHQLQNTEIQDTLELEDDSLEGVQLPQNEDTTNHLQDTITPEPLALENNSSESDGPPVRSRFFAYMARRGPLR